MARQMIAMCECGCGEATTIWRGVPRRFITGHHAWKHRMARTPEYKVYTQALYRCTNPKQAEYRHYGGRGIKFLFANFDEFIQVLGRRPTGMTLDRINNDGHYEAGNVRWVTQQVQTINRRPPKNETGLKGVRFSNERFSAQICHNYQNHYLGMFDTAEAAAVAYQEAAKTYRGAL